MIKKDIATTTTAKNRIACFAVNCVSACDDIFKSRFANKMNIHIAIIRNIVKSWINRLIVVLNIKVYANDDDNIIIVKTISIIEPPPGV